MKLLGSINSVKGLETISLFTLFTFVSSWPVIEDSMSINMDRNGILSDRLDGLRVLMANEGVAAYIVPHSDDHQSEYVGPSDERISFISGFEGSSGTVVVTMKEAVLWTDSRYYLQAEKQLGSKWTITQTSKKKNPNVAEWIVTILQPGEKVACDPKKLSYSDWKVNKDTLNASKIELVPLVRNLVDELWVGRPQYPNEPIFIYEEKYAGESVTSKITRLRDTITQSKVDALVITALDEIAWLLNLRGNDIPYTPVFVSYVLLTKCAVSLYLKQEVTPEIKDYLHKNNIQLKPYDQFWTDLEEAGATSSKILIPSSMPYSTGSSYLVYSSVPEEKILSEASPIIDMKAYKNEVEAQGTRNAHIRDSVALCQLINLMETQIEEKVHWDEMKASKVLYGLRSEQALNKGASFPSIVAFGQNGALPHYIPTPETNLNIDNSSVLTIDSGGQYLDGTIDTTRAFHFGQPSELHKKVYTLLLRGVADLASSIFPEEMTLQEMDYVLRRPLYQHGLEYGHGSTHGTGVYLGVHETFNYKYKVNFVGSQEPGYYKDNDFGMRLENLVIVVPADVENLTSKKLLTFEPLTLVPYERKLIDKNYLDNSQIKWINDYHEKVRNIVGAEMLEQKKEKLYEWLVEKTQPI